MALIEVSGISKQYTSSVDCVQALQNISFSVEKGDFVGITGASGSGKSTLLSVLGGLLQPSDGKLKIDDIDLYCLHHEKRADFRREYLGFVFQAFNLIPYLTALENVMVPLVVKKLKKQQKIEMAKKALDSVGLGYRESHLPAQLSGGEQERVAIARAIVNNPPLILADEPTGSLDSGTGKEIMDLFSSLQKSGRTILMVTHNPEYLKYFDRILALKDGFLSPDTIGHSIHHNPHEQHEFGEVDIVT